MSLPDPPMPRRGFLAFCAGALATPAVVHAQAWPERPVRLVVPFSPGGANDLLARAAAEGATRMLRQPVIIENRPGAGGNVGATAVARSAPDGHTFLVSAAGVITSPLIRRSNPYRDTDLLPVAMIGFAPSVVVVARGAPWRSLAELVEASIVALPHLREGGKFRALATTWMRRMAVAPELPTAIEQGFAQLRIAHWAGVHAPAGVPPAILDRMAAAIDAAMHSREVTDRLRPLGIEPVGGTRAAFAEFVAGERARLAAVIRAAGMSEE